MEEEQEITAPFDVETLETGWAARADARPRCYAYLSVGAKTDLGRVRENNEDKFDYLEPDDPAVLATKGRVYAVADGMGGHSAGQIASELALNVFIRTYFSDSNPEVEKCLNRAVREANAFVVDVARTVPGRSGMGTTLTAGVVRDDDLFIAQVGDSRCYLLRDGRLEQITEDHSWVAEQVRAGTMSLEDAEQSPFRNVITRSLGGAPDVEPEVYAVKMQVGDRFLFCSDGVSGMIPDPELRQLLGQGSASTCAWQLIDRANERGGKDNATVLVLHVLDIQPWPDSEVAQGEVSHGGAAQAEHVASNGHVAPEPHAESAAALSPPSRAADHAPGAKGGLMKRLFGR